jgi:hypothetical protein
LILIEDKCHFQTPIHILMPGTIIGENCVILHCVLTEKNLTAFGVPATEFNNLNKSLRERVEDGRVQGVGQVGGPVVQGSLSCRGGLDGEAEGGNHGQPRVLDFG